MGANTSCCGASRHQTRSFVRAASLVELLVVLFIIGIMLSLLLPALGGARSKAHETVCLNNIRQCSMGLRQYIHSMKRFPPENRWTVEILRWVEETNLAQAMKGNTNPNANFGRPPIYFCPFQDEYPSRVEDVSFCHFVLVVERPIKGPPEKVWWTIHDRKQLDGEPQEPWYISPEMSPVMAQSMFANDPGPHTGGLYMTLNGLQPR
jgi:type II secretory pathway pseudopilin PulG